MIDQGIVYIMYRKFIKRFLDIVLSACALIMFSPVILVVAALVRVKLGSPVIFCQERPGRDERIFKLYKFRSMTEERDREGQLLPDKVRLTKFGKLLRSTSLDELPELWNILKGDMSIVGPRPLLVKYLPYYTEEERRRHDVRPGLTGYAQIHGRNTLIWEDRFALDLYYIDHISLEMDVRIFFSTIGVAFKRSDIVTPGIMKDFDEYRRQEVSSGNAYTKEILFSS